MDPAEWPSVLNDHVRTDLVIRGPVQVDRDFAFPKTPNNRSFHCHYMFRPLVNGEKVKRSWLTYSKNNDSVYCFCCKLFSKKSLKLITEGQQDWVNIGALLKLHDNSPDHVKNVLTWKELELSLRKGKTRRNRVVPSGGREEEVERGAYSVGFHHPVSSREEPGT